MIGDAHAIVLLAGRLKNKEETPENIVRYITISPRHHRHLVLLPVNIPMNARPVKSRGGFRGG